MVTQCNTVDFDGTDLISLVEFFKEFQYFTYALKFICDICGYDYYSNTYVKEEKELLIWLDKLDNLSSENLIDIPLKPIPEGVLNKYIHTPHEKYFNEGVSIQAQNEFEIMFSLTDERIVLPIRDELGSLIGVKCRTTLREEEIEGRKFIYHYPCSEKKILYGLHKTLPFIKYYNEVIVVEGEKSVMLLWSYGYKNAVALGNKYLSEVQLDKLIKLNVPIVIALDKDVNKIEGHIKKIVDRLKIFTEVSVVWDKWSILKEKESPCDNKENWEELYSKKFLTSIR